MENYAPIQANRKKQKGFQRTMLGGEGHDGSKKKGIPADLKRCVQFHGHICPGLIYGYRVAKEAMKRLKLKRCRDEEVVVICENDSCAVDALQVILGATLGKGNLVLKDYGKNAYTVISRRRKKAYRFFRTAPYEYKGKEKALFEKLDAAYARKTASESDKRKLRVLKAADLLRRPFGDIFSTAEVPFTEPCFAAVEPSQPCASCGEMTMTTKMLTTSDGQRLCIPCAEGCRIS